MNFEDQIKRRVEYDPVTGLLTKDGRVLSSTDSSGYIRLMMQIKGVKKQFSCHRVAWFLHHGKWPESTLDHINGRRTDNRIDNLREVDRRANCENKAMASLGVVERFGKFKASFKLNGVKYYLGSYPDRETAERVYIAVKREFHEACRHWDHESIKSRVGGDSV